MKIFSHRGIGDCDFDFLWPHAQEEATKANIIRVNHFGGVTWHRHCDAARQIFTAFSSSSCSCARMTEMNVKLDVTEDVNGY